MCLGLLRVLLFQFAPLFVDVDTVYPIIMDFTVLLTLFVALDFFETRELLNGVRDIDACVDTALHDSEDFVAGRDAGNTDVEECAERFADGFLAFAFECILVIHHVVRFAIDGLGSFVLFVEGLFLISVGFFRQDSFAE